MRRAWSLAAWWVASLVAVAVLLGGCERGGGAAAPGAGSTRIVVLSPALAIILRDLGLERRIVGRHAWDMVLDPSIPSCGDQSGIDYEALLRAKPTHIVIQWGQREWPARLAQLAKENHWHVSGYDPLTLPQVLTAASELRERFAPQIKDEGKVAEADRVLSSLQGLSAPRAAGFSGSVLILESVDPPAALGPGSWHADLLAGLGAASALKQPGAYQRLDAEDVVRLNPSGIILIQPRTPRTKATPELNRAADFDAADLKMRLGQVAGWDVEAIRSGRVALIDDPMALTPSTAVIGLRERMFRILEAWAKGGGQ